MKKLKRLLFLLVVASLAGGGYLLLRDMSAPKVAVAPDGGTLSAKRPLTVKVADSGTGLGSLQVTLSQGGRSVEAVNRSFAAGTAAAEETINIAAAGLQEGTVQVQIRAVDRSHFRFGRGNVAEQALSFEFDNKPPQVAILSAHHNLNQGGAGVVVYTVSEEVDSTGIKVGQILFPGYRQPSGTYVCFFAFPWDMAPSAFVPKVVAVDKAGNERVTGIFYHINARNFPSDTINITPQFLENKIVPDFQHFFPQVTDPLELFLKVNRDLRKENLQSILDYGRQTADRPLWAGAFTALPNAASPGAFAQRRTYTHEGRVIDHQTHLGIDLASVAQAPVPAANAGSVVFADDLGIYGNCIIIDHGLGLQTLYAHLSQIGVKVGDTVSKGQIIGHTGATGLAGGDHLHYDVLIGGRQVNPLEWWDETWIRHNVLDKLALAGGSAGR